MTFTPLLARSNNNTTPLLSRRNLNGSTAASNPNALSPLSSNRPSSAPAPNLPKGLKQNAKTSVFLTSSGWPSLDKVIGGGLPVGSITLLESNDPFNGYCEMLGKTFLAQGLAHDHECFIAGSDFNPLTVAGLLNSLPELLEVDSSSASTAASAAGKENSEEKMKIAWRYQNLKDSSRETVLLKSTMGRTAAPFNHTFDVTKFKAESSVKSLIEASKIHVHEADNLDATLASHYDSILSRISTLIEERGFSIGCKEPKLLRIFLPDVFKPIWGPLNSSQSSIITRFLLKLKVLLRQAFAVCYISFPSHLYNSGKDASSFMLSPFREISDSVIRIESIPTESSLAKEYQGFFYLVKPFRINTFCAHYPSSSLQMGFKCKKKRFEIESISLPPELGETVSRTTSNSNNNGNGNNEGGVHHTKGGVGACSASMNW